MASSTTDLEQAVAQKQLQATGKWFAGGQRRANMRQLKHLQKQYGKKADITYDPLVHAWSLPKGVQGPTPARSPNGNSLIPTAGSQRRLA